MQCAADADVAAQGGGLFCHRVIRVRAGLKKKIDGIWLARRCPKGQRRVRMPAAAAGIIDPDAPCQGEWRGGIFTQPKDGDRAIRLK
ncbi:MAG: hypothetical protein HON54_03270 [Verrucomicrobia bacterium]|nr:hypothetical protein [Verrucomicrobiota bacterium]